MINTGIKGAYAVGNYPISILLNFNLDVKLMMVSNIPRKWFRPDMLSLWGNVKDVTNLTWITSVVHFSQTNLRTFLLFSCEISWNFHRMVSVLYISLNSYISMDVFTDILPMVYNSFCNSSSTNSTYTDLKCGSQTNGPWLQCSHLHLHPCKYYLTKRKAGRKIGWSHLWIENHYYNNTCIQGTQQRWLQCERRPLSHMPV